MERERITDEKTHEYRAQALEEKRLRIKWTRVELDRERFKVESEEQKQMIQLISEMCKMIL